MVDGCVSYVVIDGSLHRHVPYVFHIVRSANGIRSSMFVLIRVRTIMIYRPIMHVFAYCLRIFREQGSSASRDPRVHLFGGT